MGIKIKKPVVSALALAAISLCSVRSNAGDWKASLSATYEEGKYGSDTRTETLYLPVSVKRYFDMGEATLTVPYISQRSGGQFTIVDGAVVRKQGGSAAVATNSGIGDAILKGSVYILQENKKDPLDLSLAGKIKFPTADESKGLGTGEFDETMGIEFSKALYPSWTGFFDLYYTFIGKPAGSEFLDKVYFDIGASKRITPELTGSVFYEESTPVVSGNSDLRDVLGYLEYRVSKELGVLAGVDIGLSTGSPDYGITAGVNYRF